MTRISRLVSISGFTACTAFPGAPLRAATWYFENTTLQGTFSDDATVSGFITVTGSNFALPADIKLEGPFGELVDPGLDLHLDEGSSSFADEYVDFLTGQGLATIALTTVLLTGFTFTSAFTGSTVTDTYSLIAGELTTTAPAPEPGTAPQMVLGALGLIGAAVWLQRRRRETFNRIRVD